MGRDNTKVTVILPVYNGEHFIRDAIESILNQTHALFELIVINDGSTDGTAKIVRMYRDTRIRFLDNNDNVGLTSSLNLGLRAAQSELIARQDADDRSMPNRLEKQVQYFQEHPSTALLGTQGIAIDGNGKRLHANEGMRRATSPVAIKWQLLFDSAFIHTSVMFRRSVVWDLLGGYNESFRRNQDMELWWRIAARYDVANLPEALVESRCLATSISRSYSLQDIKKVRDVLLDRLAAELEGDTELASKWLEFWHQVTNPSVKVGVDPWRGALRRLDRIVSLYEKRWPEARPDNDYHVCLASVQARAAQFLTTVNRREACRWYAKLIASDTKHALRLAPRFGAQLLLGGRGRMVFKRLKAKVKGPSNVW